PGRINREITSPAGLTRPGRRQRVQRPGPTPRRSPGPGPRRRLGRPPSPRPRMSPMPDPQPPARDDSSPSPKGEKPCPVTYQPGAWLAQLPAEPTAAGQGHPQHPDEIDASIQQALRRLYEAMAGDPQRPGQPAS